MAHEEQVAFRGSCFCFNETRLREAAVAWFLRHFSHLLPLLPALFFSLEIVRRCWCGDDSTDYAKLGELDMTECSRPCTGDADLFCGGVDAFQIFSLPAATSQGHLGCYADKKDDRLFKAGKTNLETNSVEVRPVVRFFWTDTTMVRVTNKRQRSDHNLNISDDHRLLSPTSLARIRANRF